MCAYEYGIIAWPVSQYHSCCRNHMTYGLRTKRKCCRWLINSVTKYVKVKAMQF